MSEVQQLTDALTSLRVELNKVAQQIETKAATPAQLAELAKAIKAADPAALATSIEAAGERAGQSIERKMERRINDATTDLRTVSGRLPPLEATLTKTTADLAAAIEEAKSAGRWLNVRAALVLALAVALVAGGSYASLWWQEQQAASLKAQVADLSAQIAQEQANLAALNAKGGRVKWLTCGGKLCFQAAQNQASSNGNNPFAKWDGWVVTATKAPLVIPEGY
jgi:DNA repair exonuclease SbcCD ATPase subunit